MLFPEGAQGWIVEDCSFADIRTELSAMSGLPVYVSRERLDTTELCEPEAEADRCYLISPKSEAQQASALTQTVPEG